MGEVFIFVLECFSKVVDLFRHTMIDTNFSYFDFLVCATAAFILIELLKEIRKEKDEESRWLRDKQRNEEYNAYQRKLRQYEKERNGGN